ncbi:DUF932 domain-containing protein, partial [Candidatus Dojkabacteria bacterium]
MNKSKAQELAEKFGLAWTVEKQPTARIEGGFTVNEDGTVTLNEGAKLLQNPYVSIVRPDLDEVFASMGTGYEPTQNIDIISKVLKGMEPFGDKLNMTRANSINFGRKVEMQISIEGTTKIGDDTLTRYVQIIDSNDGSTGLMVGIGDMVWRCSNQTYHFKKSAQFRFKHSFGMKQQITLLPKVIEAALALSMKRIEVYNSFVSTKASRDLAHGLVRAMIGVDRKMSQLERSELSTRVLNMEDQLYSDIYNQMDEAGNTLWGLFNG